jgi:hypothetical protein
MVSGLKGSTYEEKCTELGLETLKSRRERQDMALVHKYVMSDWIRIRPKFSVGSGSGFESGSESWIRI